MPLIIAIAGAGIGGLSAALALSRLGHAVTVYEAVEEIRPLGVGINLMPTATAILDGWGVLEALLEAGVATRELIYFNKFGQKIWGESRGRFAGYATPQVSVSRGQLQATLLAACKAALGPDNVVCDRRLVAFSNNDSGVDISFESRAGERRALRADLLIAADGIHSRARAQLYPDEGAPVFAGRILWRGTSYASSFLSGASMFMAGHQAQKFVAYPIEPVRADGLQRINWIAELAVEQSLRREDWNRPGNFADFLPRFETWQFGWLDVPALIRRADNVYEYPLVDRDPLPQWSFGRMTLLGDAAHPMFPIGSNGASQAILDAQALAACVAGASDPAAALAAYEAQRRPTTSSIVLANRGNGPEQCMQVVEERAPNGFAAIEDVMAPGEIEAITEGYKQLTGMARPAGQGSTPAVAAS